MRITPVILSGGGGTRLWPMSRPERPKQFLALTGDQTMLQLTLERTRDKSLFAPPIIVAGAEHAATVQQQLAEIGLADAKIVLEPIARNTAPAIALAALAVANPKTMLLIMPSDHMIADVEAFRNAINAASAVAEEGWLVTFGIAPTGPETGYGYIKMAEKISPDVKRVALFIEKPDAERASDMIAEGNHVWNGGIFLFRADRYLQELAIHAPEMLNAVQAAMANARVEGSLIHPDLAQFASSPADSIDYAVMEKADRVAVVPVQMGWSDVGSWDALYDLGGNDPSERHASAHIIEIEGSGNLIRSDGIHIHMVGVENMVVVASGNDILIVPRGSSQDVKKIVAALKEKSQ